MQLLETKERSPLAQARSSSAGKKILSVQQSKTKQISTSAGTTSSDHAGKNPLPEAGGSPMRSENKKLFGN